MGYIGKQPTPVPLTASDITDGIISTDKLAANAVTSAKITDGTIATADIADSAVTSVKASGITSEPFRNILINGDMSVSQRGTVTGINTNTYTLDRWITEGDDATITVSQDTSVPTGMGFRNSLKIAVTTANTSVAASEEQKIGQRIEGRMLQTLKYGTSSATTATLSFWVRSNITGTYAIQFQDDDNDKVQTKTYSISSGDTWEKKTVTIAANTSNTLDNDNNRSFRILWWLTAGSNYTSSASSSGAWTARSSNLATIAYGHAVNTMSATSNTFYMTGCQLEIGSTASDFEFLPLDVNLNRCKRYYQKLGNTSDDYSFGRVNDSFGIFGTVLPVTMRADPSATLMVDPENGGFSSVSMGHTGPNFVATDATGSSWADIGQIIADAEL